jgi:hypothetical protein
MYRSCTSHGYNQNQDQYIFSDSYNDIKTTLILFVAVTQIIGQLKARLGVIFTREIYQTDLCGHEMTGAWVLSLQIITCI